MIVDSYRRATLKHTVKFPSDDDPSSAKNSLSPVSVLISPMVKKEADKATREAKKIPMTW